MKVVVRVAMPKDPTNLTSTEPRAVQDLGLNSSTLRPVLSTPSPVY